MKKTPKLFWLWKPIVNCLLLTLGYFVVQLLLRPFRGEWGALGFVLIFLALYSIIIAPLMSIVYCKRICAMGWTKYLCCIYNSIMIGMYYTVCLVPSNLEHIQHIMTSVLSIPWLSVFFSSLICGLITLIVHDVKRNNVSK